MNTCTHLNTHISTHIHIHRKHIFKQLQLLIQRQKDKTKPEEDTEKNSNGNIFEISGTFLWMWLWKNTYLAVHSCNPFYASIILLIRLFLFSLTTFFGIPSFYTLPPTRLSSVSLQILLQLPCPHRFLWSRLRHITMVWEYSLRMEPSSTSTISQPKFHQ